MAETDRPPWCPELECEALTGYNARICVGRLPVKRRHDDLFNTHNLCLGRDNRLEINDADAYYLGKCLAAVRRDVERRGLYCEGKGEVYDFGR